MCGWSRSFARAVASPLRPFMRMPNINPAKGGRTRFPDGVFNGEWAMGRIYEQEPSAEENFAVVDPAIPGESIS